MCEPDWPTRGNLLNENLNDSKRMLALIHPVSYERTLYPEQHSRIFLEHIFSGDIPSLGAKHDTLPEAEARVNTM